MYFDTPTSAYPASTAQVAGTEDAPASATAAAPAADPAPTGASAVVDADAVASKNLILTVCGNGLGTSLFLKNTAEQVLDPDEAHFPYDGAVEFRSGSLRHDSRDAGGLRAAYLARLAERQAWLEGQARRAGWQFGTHLTDADPAQALNWLWQALGQGAR